MNVEVDYEVLLSRLDWETHAFDPGDADEASRTAACGAKVLGLALENNDEPVPGCFDCALKLGIQVEQKIMKRDQETRNRIDAEAAKAAAAQLTALITAACRLHGPAYTKAIRDLRRESTPVRAWVRWNRITTVFLPLGAVLLASGIIEVATRAVAGWTIPSLIAGTSFLLITVFGLARGIHRALQVALGVHLHVQPGADTEQRFRSDDTDGL